jgi:HAD superfamily hydrolase (TIGR01509 family)
MKKYILFDHDGVLVETEYWYYMANQRAMQSLGFEIERETYLANMAHGISPWEWARAEGMDETAAHLGRALRNRYYQQYLIHENIEIRGVPETLGQLWGKYKMAIVTTSRREDFDLIHKNRRILRYMDFCLTVEDYERAKPHPEPYLAGLRRFKAVAKEAVVVEDSARGLKSAVAAGIDCIVVANAFTASHDLSAAGMKIDGFAELPAALERLNIRAGRNGAALAGR